jgi:hypothetical protein
MRGVLGDLENVGSGGVHSRDLDVDGRAAVATDAVVDVGPLALAGVTRIRCGERRDGKEDDGDGELHDVSGGRCVPSMCE